MTHYPPEFKASTIAKMLPPQSRSVRALAKEIEATLKTVGAGLRRAAEVRLSPLLMSAAIDGVTVHTCRLALADGCVATLATRAPVGRVRLEERILA